MTDERPIDPSPDAPVATETHRRSTGARVAGWAAGLIGGLVLLAVLIVFGLNTDPGRRFVARQISGYELASGLRFEVGRLDGSLYGGLTIRDLRIYDARGQFAAIPELALDWRPFAFASNHVDIRSARAPFVRVARLPELIADPDADPNAPLLPDLDIDIGSLRIDRLVLDAPVTGERRVLSVAGGASIADGRAQLNTNVAAIGGGDRIALRLDAVPEADRLDIAARIQAPAGGVVASLAGLEAPLVAAIDGQGSWSNWRGRARATLGGEGLADLAIAARDGTFRVTGPLQPGLILEGPAARLTAPRLDLDLVTRLEDRRATGRLTLGSDALAVRAAGLVDLGESSFSNLRVDAQLLTPGAIAENLNGRDVRLALRLDGAFATPRVDYILTAGAIGFGETVVERLEARGAGRVDADRIIVPIQARAARITGLNAAAGGLLTNVAINGEFAMQGDTILSDNLRIRSDRIDATALIVADLSTGIYSGAINGRINDYAVAGVGILNVTTDIELVTTPSGGFGLSGRIGAQTVRIDNQAAADFLGGRTIVAADVSFDPEGLASIRGLRVTAPDFRLTSGSGSYRLSDGRVQFQAAGISDVYGPLTVGVTGTATQPLIRLTAASPNVGVQLSDVEAVIRGTGLGYQVDVAGGSPYGPFVADLFVTTGRGPLAVDIAGAQFAGINFVGRVVQSPAGPFTGRVTLAGQGLEGAVVLRGQGAVQGARVQARAFGFAVPGEMPILIQRAIVDADILLYEDAPQIVADVQAAGVRSGALLVDTSRARINYRGGAGTVQLVASGTSGARFRVAANARLTPQQALVAATGTVNGVDLRLARPAVVELGGETTVLRPATIVFPQGEVRVAGRYGGGRMELQSRFDGFDLAIVNAFSPGAGIGGRATGSLDFAQSGDAFPRADLRLAIDDFTRSGVATVSQAIDVALRGTLRPEGGDLRAVMRRGGGVIGRVQARLQPVGGGGPWTERLLAGTLGGGIRYNGPADALWSLSGIVDQTISGPIGIAADFSGRVSQPQLAGVLRSNTLVYTNETYGTRISAIRLDGRFTNDRLEIAQFSGTAGDGTISGSGSVGLSAAAGFPIDIDVALTNAQLARGDALAATVSGTVSVTNSAAAGAVISGELQLPEVRYVVVRQSQVEIADLEGVRRRGTPSPAALQAQQQAAAAAAQPPGLFRLDLRVRADNQLFVSGMGLESEWAADLRVTGTSADPRVIGNVELVRGTYSFAGKRFELDQASLIRFDGGPLTNPELQISAVTTVDGITATIDIGGRAQNPQIVFGSVPQLPQDEVLSRLLFGNSVTELSATQALQLAAALNSLRGSGGGGINPLGALQSATGIDRLRILGADEATGRGTAIAAGTYISNDIYLEVITDTRGFTATQIEIALSRTLSLLSATGSFGGSNVSLRYSRDY